MRIIKDLDGFERLDGKVSLLTEGHKQCFSGGKKSGKLALITGRGSAIRNHPVEFHGTCFGICSKRGLSV
jgi:hypothetical protein